ncbi:hypothetical protein BDDG_13448, partial [Blastomyces dermatitidis ATCC 18188]
ILRDLSLINNEIAEVRHSRLCRQKESDCRPVRSQKTLTISEALQELSTRVCKKLLMRRLTAKRETVLLKVRD